MIEEKKLEKLNAPALTCRRNAQTHTISLCVTVSEYNQLVDIANQHHTNMVGLLRIALTKTYGIEFRKRDEKKQPWG